MLSIIIVNRYNFKTRQWKKMQNQTAKHVGTPCVHWEPLIFLMVRLRFVELGTSNAL